MGLIVHLELCSPPRIDSPAAWEDTNSSRNLHIQASL
jgi:hypothetical protein